MTKPKTTTIFDTLKTGIGIAIFSAVITWGFRLSDKMDLIISINQSLSDHIKNDEKNDSRIDERLDKLESKSDYKPTFLNERTAIK